MLKISKNSLKVATNGYAERCYGQNDRRTDQRGKLKSRVHATKNNKSLGRDWREVYIPEDWSSAPLLPPQHYFNEGGVG